MSRRCCAPLHSVLINSEGVYRFYNVGILIHRRIHTIATRKSVRDIHRTRSRQGGHIQQSDIYNETTVYIYIEERIIS